jgi:proton glutamate symport protein
MPDASPLPRWVPSTLTQWIGVAVVIGLVLGLAAHGQEPTPGWVAPLALFGDLFIKCLKLLILPVIATSLVVGVTSIGDLSRLGRLGGRTLIFYTGTTLTAAILGLLLVNVIQPGAGLSGAEATEIPEKAARGSGLTVGAMLMQVFGSTLLDPLNSLRDGDVLTWIALALLVGVALIAAGERGRGLTEGFRTAERVVMRVVRNVMWLAPPGVLGLLVKSLAAGGLGALIAVGKYSFTVAFGLALHGTIVLPLVVAYFGGMSPRTWFQGIRPALAVALGTSSSSATLPVTIEACEDNLGVPTGVASFVLPLGATMNMDGTALYEAVAALFVAQVFGFDLTLAQQGVVLFTAMAASVGAAGIPSAGLVTMAMVFEAVGLPLEGIGLILAVDRFLDMGRTMVNVAGDTAGAVVLSRGQRSPVG